MGTSGPGRVFADSFSNNPVIVSNGKLFENEIDWNVTAPHEESAGQCSLPGRFTYKEVQLPSTSGVYAVGAIKSRPALTMTGRQSQRQS